MVLYISVQMCVCPTPIVCFLQIELLLQILYTVDDLEKGTFSMGGRKCLHPKDIPNQVVVLTLFRLQRYKGYQAQ